MTNTREQVGTECALWAATALERLEDAGEGFLHQIVGVDGIRYRTRGVHTRGIVARPEFAERERIAITCAINKGRVGEKISKKF